MRLLFALFAIALLPLLNVAQPQATHPPSASECRALYLDMDLDGVVNYTAFSQAILGMDRMTTDCKGVITLIDFTKPSTEKRLYVLDIHQKKMLFHSHVSHGQKSGDNFATSFSNVVGSHQSSLGFYVTGGTYQGRNGYSLILDGLEKGINDKARERAVVIHGANYCDPSRIASNGRLGRSFGCPALPQIFAEPIINTIKDGTLLYIYANDSNYLKKSSILSSTLLSPSTLSSALAYNGASN